MKASLAIFFCLSTTGLIVAGCGGKKGTVELDIVVSPFDDPFINAGCVRFTIGGVAHTSQVANGHFTFSSEQSPPKTAAPVYIDAMDNGCATVLGHGETPVLGLSAMDQGPYSVWVGTLGKIGAAPAKLDTPRAEMAAVNSTGLGAIFAGGRDTTLAPLAQVAIYDVFTQSILQSEDQTIEPMTSARAGAVAIADPPNGIVFGGSQATGFNAFTKAINTAELFDPSGDVWDAVPVSSGTIGAAAYPSATTFATGTALISGGFDATGARTTSALTVPTGGSTTALTPGTPMQEARAYHAMAPATFPGGDGALIIGGLEDTNTAGAIVEQYVNSTFTTPMANGPVENRYYATAVQVGNGVLVIGGTIPGTGGARAATKSSLFIATSTGVPTVTRYEDASSNAILSTARSQHTLTQIGSQLLVCGGVDENGTALASCDLIDTSPMITLNKTIQTGNTRFGHAAVQLETGPVLLAGGFSSAGVPLNTIEIYTPETVLTPAPTTTTTSNAATITFTLKK